MHSKIQNINGRTKIRTGGIGNWNKKNWKNFGKKIGVKVAHSGLPVGLFDYCDNRLVLTAACNDKKEGNERKKKWIIALRSARHYTTKTK